MVSYSCRVVLVSGSDWFGLLDFWRLGVKQLLRKKIQQWENAYCILQAAQIQNANQGLEETLLFQSNELKIELLHYPDASVESAGSNGHRLLQSAEIQSVLQTYWRNRAMGVDELFYHLAEIARGIPAEYYHSDGRLNFEKLKRDGKTQLVAGITENRNGRSFKLQDRQRALEMIGRGMGAFMDAKNEGVQEIIVTLQGLTQQPPPPAISASSPPALGGGDTAVEGEYTDGD
jgi:hypothetical protein